MHTGEFGRLGNGQVHSKEVYTGRGRVGWGRGVCKGTNSHGWAWLHEPHRAGENEKPWKSLRISQSTKHLNRETFPGQIKVNYDTEVSSTVLYKIGHGGRLPNSTFYFNWGWVSVCLQTLACPHWGTHINASGLIFVWEENEQLCFCFLAFLFHSLPLPQMIAETTDSNYYYFFKRKRQRLELC